MEKTAQKKIQALAAQLTLEEKIGMVHGAGLFRTEGVPRLGIPPFVFSDGPMGVRCEFENNTWIQIGHTDDYVTYLPCGSAIAATWNPMLSRAAGRVLGRETRGRGKDMILGPSVNIKRSPLCGRNFEYFSEDPFLTAEQAVPFVEGIQESDVAACVKHFAANNQETNRLAVDVEVDERTLHEIYLPAFHAAVQAGTLGVMGAYNRLFGEHCCHSAKLLDGILRDEWGFDGVVVSDWGGVHDTSEAACTSLDMEMSVTDNFDEYYMASPLRQAIEKGKLSEELLDRKVLRILSVMERLHMLDGVRQSGAYNTPEHRQTALDIARESVVLLKNEQGRLPLAGEKLRRLLVIGENANRIHSNGGGSAEIKALYEITPLMGLKTLLGGNTEVRFVPGYRSLGEQVGSTVNWQADSLSERVLVQNTADEQKAHALFEEAVGLAAEYDDVVFIGGLSHAQDLEGFDRPDMALPYGQDALIRALLHVNPRTIVVLTGGSPVTMDWAEEAQAIVWGWYAGCEGGTALAEALLGRINPSGKLPETFGKRLSDYPAHSVGEFPGGDTVRYKEGVFVGYRHFHAAGIDPAFCFGHGLSYTKFNYSAMRAEIVELDGLPAVRACLTVRNCGDRAGKETVQLYVRPQVPGDAHPLQQLRAYEKVALAAGEETEVAFLLDAAAFAFYDTDTHSFSSPEGSFHICAGSSSRDLRAEAAIAWPGTAMVSHVQ